MLHKVRINFYMNCVAWIIQPKTGLVHRRRNASHNWN